MVCTSFHNKLIGTRKIGILYQGILWTAIPNGLCKRLLALADFLLIAFSSLDSRPHTFAGVGKTKLVISALGHSSLLDSQIVFWEELLLLFDLKLQLLSAFYNKALTYHMT